VNLPAKLHALARIDREESVTPAVERPLPGKAESPSAKPAAGKPAIGADPATS
jgi:hypothetical protein